MALPGIRVIAYNVAMHTLPMSRRYAGHYTYPEHLREQVASAPSAPGVYVFYGHDSRIPLYIGKSVNIRSRLLAHLRAPDEARLLLQAQRIEFQRTAGEIGALLLESHMIKSLHPLFNKRLRRSRSLCSIRLGDGQVELVDTAHEAKDNQLFGLFRNRRSANQALQRLADVHGLCLGVMGIEPIQSRGCFRAQIKRCHGACHGLESQDEHTARLQAALEHLRVRQWPFPGAIAVHEQHQELEEYHVVNHWHYFGSFSTEQQARQAPSSPPATFDADSYKILLHPLLDPATEIIPLSRQASHAQARRLP